MVAGADLVLLLDREIVGGELRMGVALRASSFYVLRGQLSSSESGPHERKSVKTSNLSYFNLLSIMTKGASTLHFAASK